MVEIDRRYRNWYNVKSKFIAVEKNVYYLGTIDIDKYIKITDKKIITDQVVITDNRIQHIIERRGRQFYEKYASKFVEIIKDPDYIFKDKSADSAIVCKTFVDDNGSSINIVIRLSVEGDDPEHKNSIITAMIENSKRFAQRLRNNTAVYSKLDKIE